MQFLLKYIKITVHFIHMFSNFDTHINMQTVVLACLTCSVCLHLEAIQGWRWTPGLWGQTADQAPLRWQITQRKSLSDYSGQKMSTFHQTALCLVIHHSSIWSDRFVFEKQILPVFMLLKGDVFLWTVFFCSVFMNHFGCHLSCQYICQILVNYVGVVSVCDYSLEATLWAI